MNGEEESVDGQDGFQAGHKLVGKEVDGLGLDRSASARPAMDDRQRRVFQANLGGRIEESANDADAGVRVEYFLALEDAKTLESVPG